MNLPSVQVMVLSPVLVAGHTVEPGQHRFEPLTASRLVATRRAELVDPKDRGLLRLAEEAEIARALRAERAGRRRK